MTRVLVRSYQNPLALYTPESASKKMGGNEGNLLYANGVARILSSSQNKVGYGYGTMHSANDPDKYASRINAEFDHFVLPLANSFRASFSAGLKELTEIIKRLEIPVTLVGVGAQALSTSFDTGDFSMARTGHQASLAGEKAVAHNEVVRNFCEAVLERSNEIGVRGQYTKEFLESIGIPSEKVRVIGCPSLFTWGPELRLYPKVSALSSKSRISLNFDHRVAGIDRVIDANFQRYRRLTAPVQDSKSIRAILSGEDVHDLERVNLGTPIHTAHPMYKARKVLYYPNPWGWIESFKDQDFTFGTRLHGNIASILGGTPAHLLAHDSRTIELAEFHGIPFTRYEKDAKPPLAAELFERTDYTQFNMLQPERYENFIDFLHMNGLHTIADEGGTAPSFDTRIAKGRKVGAIRPESQSAAVRKWEEVSPKARKFVQRTARKVKQTLAH